MSLAGINAHLDQAHSAVGEAIEHVKAAVDNSLSNAHVAVGAAMADGLSGQHIDEIAGLLTGADHEGNDLVALLAAVQTKITELIEG